ncbi:hypothetical protein V6N13_098337 [Hibiscus sabdariffa]|uniref:Uncharacterized protein n=1 Tax=Hibiscus sabdariffa TaxID=183260 RepID=A0ABR2EDH2_9ROSI
MTAVGPEKSSDKNEMEGLIRSTEKGNINWVELLFKNQLTQNEFEPERVEQKVGTGNLGLEEPNEVVKNRVAPEVLSPKSPKYLGSRPNQSLLENQFSTVRKEVKNPQLEDGQIFEGGYCVEKVEDWISSPESEENFRNAERVFFPEWESKREKKKRYGSMIQLQDKALSEKEKKNRDWAIHREKKKSKSCEPSELSGKSLSESDLVQHMEILSKKARKEIEMGKRCWDIIRKTKAQQNNK